MGNEELEELKQELMELPQEAKEELLEILKEKFPEAAKRAGV
jgi:uncharacterized membrane protein